MALVVSLVATVSAAAFQVDGFKETRVDLHEAGVWVTKPGGIGRLNTQIKSIELSIQATLGVDVAQSGPTVVLFDSAKGTMQGVNPSLASKLPLQSIPKDGAVAIGGPVGMVADPGRGLVWVAPATEMGSLDTKKARAAFKAAGTERKTSSAIGVDGLVHAYQYGTKVVKVIALDGERKVAVTDEALTAQVAKPQLTAVGARTVLLDGEKGRLVVPSGATVELRKYAETIVLQQPGPESAEVLVGADSKLLAIDLETGQIRTVATGKSGGPSNPVWVDGCAFAAWSAKGAIPSTARWCENSRLGAQTSLFKDAAVKGGNHLVFRVNRDRVILNDTKSGVNLTVDDAKPQVVKDWEQSLDKTQADSNEKEKVEQKKDPTCAETPTAPETVPDKAGTRPDRPVVVRVLDNDRTDSCDVLSLKPYAKDDQPDGATVVVVDNGGALQVTPDSGRTAPINVQYSASGRSGQEVLGTLTVTISGEGINGKPQPADDETVVQVGRSVNHNVLANDIDPDGDPLNLISVSQPREGRVLFQANGVVTYRAPGVNPGRVVLSYTVADDSGLENDKGKLTIEVVGEGSNLAPTAHLDRLTAVVGRDSEVNVLRNDTDPNGDLLKVSSVDDTAGLGVTWEPDGTFRVTPTKEGRFYVGYDVHDGQAAPVKGTVLVDVAAGGGNHDPIAVRDDLIARPGTPTMVDLAANDLDADGDLLAITSVSVPPESGLSVELLEMRIARVTAGGSFDRSTVVPYTVSDGRATATGRLIVRPHRISGQDQEPMTVADSASVRPGNVRALPVLANDLDPEGEQLTLVSVKALDPSMGRIFVQEDQLRYQASAGVRRSVTTTYTVRDPAGNTADGDVRIDIIDPAEANQPPIAPRLEARVFAGKTVPIRVPLLSLDPDGDTVSIVGVVPSDPPRLGTLVMKGDGFEYTAGQRAGADSFSFTVRDAGRASATGKVRVVVAAPSPSNTPPMTVPDKAWVLAGQSRVLPVLANDVDVDGDDLALDPNGGLSGPAKGRGSVKLDGDRLVYSAPSTIAEDDPGVSFTYGVNDRRGGSARGLVTVALLQEAPENEAPIAKDDFVETQLANRKITVPVLENDRDPDDLDPEDADKGLAVRVVDFSSARALADGTIEVSLGTKPVTFVYEITDNGGTGGKKSAFAVVSIPVVTAFPPVAEADEVAVQAGDSVAKPVSVLANDRNPSGSKADLRVDKVFNQSNGIQTELSNAGVVNVKAATGAGSGSFSYRLTNGPEVAVGTVAVTVTPAPGTSAPPTFTSTNVELAAGQSKTLDLQLLTNDIDTKSHEFATTTQPTRGVSATLSGAGNRTLTITAAEASGDLATEVGITVSDGTTQVAGRISIQVSETPVDLPVAVDDTGTTRQGEPVTINVTGNDVDPVGKGLDVLIESVAGGAGRATISGGAIVFEPAESFSGTALVTYMIRDRYKTPREATANVRITVYGRPGAPPAPSGTTESKIVRLTWGSADPHGSPITGYVVESEAGGIRQKVPSNSAEVRGLKNGTGYRFRVAALNEHFNNETDSGLKWSGWSATLTPDQRPESPTGVQARFDVARNNGKAGGVLHLSWSAAMVDGSPVQSYHVSTSPPSGMGTQQVSGTTTSLEWTGLTNGTSYTFTVVAENLAGKSDPSAPSNPETPAGVPAQVTGVSAQRVSDSKNDNGGFASVQWNAADSGGDAAGLRFRVISSPGSPESPKDELQGTSVEFGGLDPSTPYSFTVVPFNKAGDGAVSASSSGIYAEGKPLPPASPRFLPGDGSVALTGIVTPDARGPGAVTYEYSNSGDSSGFTALAGSSIGVPNGNTVSIWVRACKYSSSSGVAPGCGSSSQASNQTTGATTVTPFGNPVVGSSHTDRTITWNWSAQPGVTSYSVGGQSGGTQGPTSYTQTFGYSERRCLDVTATGQGVSRTSAGKCETTDDAPPPPQVVTIARGPRVTKSGCTSSACAAISVSISGFPSGVHTLDCWGSKGGWSSFWSGVLPDVDQNCYFGYPGFQVKVYVDGVESNTLSW